MSYYFLKYNLVSLNSNNFVGLFIDPFKSPIITIADLGIAAILVSPVLIHKIWQYRLAGSRQRENRLVPNALIVAIFSILLVIQIYALGSSGANLIPLKGNEHIPPRGWENNVFDVIEYLNHAEQGNVLSVRAPAIPFFTNRTNFDLFNFQTFAYNISDVLSTNTSNLFKNSLLKMGIKYIILPSERSNLKYAVKNLTTRYPMLETLSADKDFEKVSFKDFNIYKFTPTVAGRINLIDKNHIWKSFGQAEISQNADNLTIRVDTHEKDRLYNRGFLQSQLNLTNPLLLSLDYKVETNVGNATYAIEIRNRNSSNILFDSLLDNVSGNATNKTFILPTNINLDEPLEFRVYVITQGTGYHALTINKLSVLNT